MRAVLISVLMRVVNTTLHLSLSIPTQDAVLKEKLCLRCFNTGESFQSAHQHLLNPTITKAKPNAFRLPRRTDFFSPSELLLHLMFITTVPIPSNPSHPALWIQFRRTRRKIWKWRDRVLESTPNWKLPLEIAPFCIGV